MPDSTRLLFFAAGGGYVTPTILRWSTQEQITLPGDTWLVTLGWFASTLTFATLASLFVLHIWKEKTARRAFIAGLVLPYVLSGAVADVASVAKVRRLGAQTSFESPVSGATKTDLTAFKVDVIGADTEKALPTARMRIYLPGGDSSTPVATSTTANLGAFAVPPGKYRLHTTAPGYWPKTIDVDAKDVKTSEQITIKLERATWWQQLWTGAKSAALPQRLPMDLP